MLWLRILLICKAKRWIQNLIHLFVPKIINETWFRYLTRFQTPRILWCGSLRGSLICAGLKNNHEFNSSCRNTSFANPNWSARGNFNWIKFGADILVWPNIQFGQWGKGDFSVNQLHSASTIWGKYSKIHQKIVWQYHRHWLNLAQNCPFTSPAGLFCCQSKHL